jgi:hypothetical protein
MPSEKGPEHQETAPKVNDQEGEKIVFQITEGDIFRATNNIFLVEIGKLFIIFLRN